MIRYTLLALGAGRRRGRGPRADVPEVRDGARSLWQAVRRRAAAAQPGRLHPRGPGPAADGPAGSGDFAVSRQARAMRRRSATSTASATIRAATASTPGGRASRRTPRRRNPASLRLIGKARQPAGLFFGPSALLQFCMNRWGRDDQEDRTPSRGDDDRRRGGACQPRRASRRSRPSPRSIVVNHSGGAMGTRHAQGLLHRLREEVRHPGGRDEPGRFRQAARHGRVRQRRMGRHRDRRPGRDPRHRDEAWSRRSTTRSSTARSIPRRRARPTSSPRRSTRRSSATAPTSSKAAPSPRAGPTAGTSRSSPARARCATIRPTISSSR